MIELRTGGKVFRYFSEININLLLNTIGSTFQFTGLNENNPATDGIFKPFGYTPCTVWYVDQTTGEQEKLISGLIVNPGLSVEKTPKLNSVSGFSKTGIFENINIPTALYPLERKNVGLDVIAKELCDYFGITLKIFEAAKADAAKPFEKTKASPTETIKSYLSKLCRQRDITLAHDNQGRLLLYKILNVIEAQSLIDENDQTLKISTSPNGQQMHTSVTVINEADINDNNAGETTINSPFVEADIKLPKVTTLKDGDNQDTGKLARSIVASEARNMPIVIEKEGWLFAGRLVRAGFFLEVIAPSILKRKTKMIVESVQFKATPSGGKTLTITAVLPCVYTGIPPSSTPFK